ncbi:MAG: hypothetical protein GXP19_09355 [Gammaproteobacteria bacterium]|nr:hypothetical protein [Gammaproteobacteria bacterium]
MLLIFFSLLLSHSALAEINVELQKKLLAMEFEDQEIRKNIMKFGAGKVPQALLDKAHKIDDRNTKKIKDIVAGNGWPTKELVGVEGVSAAFIIVQHSLDLNFQESMLSNLGKSYERNEGISGQQLALLTDRVLLARGKKQTYGTQVAVENNEIIFKPIEDKKIVDKLRAKMKMPPLAFYKKVMEEAYGIKDHPDIDLD